MFFITLSLRRGMVVLTQRVFSTRLLRVRWLFRKVL